MKDIKPSSAKKTKVDRHQRLSVALRANLRKRKAQAQERKEGTDEKDDIYCPSPARSSLQEL